MNLGWLAVLGIFLLLAGLCTVAYDGLRRRRGNNPFPFPDAATNRLKDTAVQTFAPSPSAPSGGAGILLKRLRLPSAWRQGRSTASPTRSRASADFFTRLLLALPRRSVVIVVLASLSLLGVSALVLVAGASPPAPTGAVVLGITPFGTGPLAAQAEADLADYIRRSASAGGPVALQMRLSGVVPRDAEQAESERARLGADFLLWGTPGADGMFTASLTLSPHFAAGSQPWEALSDPDLDALVLPSQVTIVFPPGAGTDPLVPLTLAVTDYRFGNFKSAADAAWGAQETLDQAGAQGEFARLLEAESRFAQGDYAGSASAIATIERAGEMSSDARLARAASSLGLNELSAVLEDCNYVIGDRNAPDRELALAYLLRARLRYASGDFAQALNDLTDSARLDPGNLRTKFDRAQVLYRMARPSEAAGELADLLKGNPDAAPAYRLSGLVQLMLGQPQRALAELDRANGLYNGWIGTLRSEEAQASASGNSTTAARATEGIVRLNKELAALSLYEGMAWADIAAGEPKETFLGSIWRGIRGEPTTWERALAKMQEASRLDPRRPDVPLQIGTLYMKQGDFANATTMLQQVRDLDPNAPEPYVALAQAQEAQNQPQQAIATLNDLLARSPRYYDAYDKIAVLYNSLGDSSDAQTTLERAAAIEPHSASDHLWRGKFLIPLGRTSEAESELRTAGEDSQYWEAHLLLGKLLLNSGRGPEALAEFQQVLSTQPDNEAALLNAGNLLVLAGKQDDAQKLLERLTAISPGNVDAHIALLQLLLARGDTGRAIAEGKKGVAAGDARSDAHFFLGVAYDAAADRHDSSTEFAAATTRDSNNFQAFLSLSRSLFKEDRYQEAISAAETAHTLRPDDPQPYRWKAESQLALGDADGSLATLGILMDVRSDDADVLALTSRAYAAKGDDGSALGYANKATAAAPNNPAGVLALGDLYLSEGKSQDALQEYATALEFGDAATQSAATLGEGRSYALTGATDQALKLYASASSRDPSAAEPYLYTGHIYSQTGNLDAAANAYRRAVELRPNWPVALYYLGKTLLQREDLRNAQAAFAKAVTYSPNMVEAWFGLGIAQRDQGHSKEAIEALTRATQLNSNYAQAWLYLETHV